MPLLRKISKAIVGKANKSNKPVETSSDDNDARRSILNVKQPGKTVTDLIGYELMHEDGICRIEEGRYSSMLAFDDVSYQDRRYDEQFEIFSTYTEFLNSFDSALDMQLVFTNQLIKSEEIKKTMFLELSDDDAHARDNDFRREINNMISTKVLTTAQSVARNRYLIFSGVAPTKDDAQAQLLRAGEAAIRKFEDMGAEMHAMDGRERLSALASILRPKDDLKSQDFDYEDLRVNPGLSTKDLIAPYSLDKVSGTVFKFGDYFGQVLTVTKYAKTIKDEVLAEFCGLPMDLVISMHVKTIEQADAIDLIDQQLTDMKTEKTHLMRKNSSKFFYTDEMLPPKLKDGIENAERLHSDVLSKDQKMFTQTLLFFTYAKTQEELQHNIDELERVARTYQYKLDPVNNMQRSRCVRSILPLGNNAVPIGRLLTTAPLGAFMPFISEELMQPGGAYYGENMLSKNPIFFSRKSLDAPNGFIVGKPGRGKSFAAKQEITNTLLTDPLASVDVIDPEREFTNLANENGFDGEIIHISSKSKNYINPFDISEDYSDDDDPLTVKTEFILSLVKEMAGGLTESPRVLRRLDSLSPMLPA